MSNGLSKQYAGTAAPIEFVTCQMRKDFGPDLFGYIGQVWKLTELGCIDAPDQMPAGACETIEYKHTRWTTQIRFCR